MRFARVSGDFPSWIRWRIAYGLWLSSVSKKLRAAAFEASGA
jgi:hypothetical protein